MANKVDFFFLDIQQLSLGPITNIESDNSKNVSNPNSINDEILSKIIVTINHAIWVAYSKTKKHKKKLNALNTNQRILIFF